jgi:hypothetical protein
VAQSDSDSYRDRLLKNNVAKRFFQEGLKQTRERNVLSEGTLHGGRDADGGLASLKSFQRKEQEKQENGDEEKDRDNANVNFRGEKRSNQTHESKTDPDAKLARKGDGKETKLSYNGKLLVVRRRFQTHFCLRLTQLRNTGISGLISGEAFYFWYGLA